MPSWAICSVENPYKGSGSVAPTSLRSASYNAERNFILYNTSLADVLTSKVELLEREADRIKSASSASNKPSWAASLRMFDDN